MASLRPGQNARSYTDTDIPGKLLYAHPSIQYQRMSSSTPPQKLEPCGAGAAPADPGTQAVQMPQDSGGVKEAYGSVCK